MESVQGVVQSLAMIIFSEIGDKTFLITVILAMRHSQLAVFLGAFVSLVLMSFLSAAMGNLFPTFIPRSWTQFAASFLFLLFGAKMFAEGREMKSGLDKIEEEMREAEEEIEDYDAAHHNRGLPRAGFSMALGEMTPRDGQSRPDVPNPTTPKRPWKDGARNFWTLFFGPVFVQTFVLTFFGEWGDRSQIATVALGAAHVGFSPFKRTSRSEHPGTECIYCYIGNCNWPHILHCPCYTRWAIHLEENFR